MHIRPPAVAGQFYPSDATELRETVGRLLMEKWENPKTQGRRPKVLIAPHAGYEYSGEVAASAYAQLFSFRDKITRVVILAPSHRVSFEGLAVPTKAYETPLGTITLDEQRIAQTKILPQVTTYDEAHTLEHSLEVHLPFLQETLKDFQLLPVIVGPTPPETIASFLDCVWGGEETLIIISTDLSHYLSYEKGKVFDEETATFIENYDHNSLDGDRACGHYPLSGLLLLAKEKKLDIQRLDVRSSGDFASTQQDTVVGYGSFCLYEDPPSLEHQEETAKDLINTHKDKLFDIAFRAIRTGLRQESKLDIGFPTLPLCLRLSGAVFVTLTKSGNLRGCIGSIVAYRPLALDVAYHAFGAAFQDRRFGPLEENEWDDLELSISLLSNPSPFAFSDEADVVARMRPNIDGFILSDAGKQGVFLPSVWEELPQPQDFLNHLKRKAGFPLDYWSPTLTLKRFTTHSVKTSTKTFFKSSPENNA